MQRTKIIETEVSTGGNAGAATSIGSATCVRLHNDTGGIITVGVSTIVVLRLLVTSQCRQTQ